MCTIFNPFYELANGKLEIQNWLKTWGLTDTWKDSTWAYFVKTSRGSFLNTLPLIVAKNCPFSISRSLKAWRRTSFHDGTSAMLTGSSLKQGNSPYELLRRALIDEPSETTDLLEKVRGYNSLLSQIGFRGLDIQRISWHHIDQERHCLDLRENYLFPHTKTSDKIRCREN